MDDEKRVGNGGHESDGCPCIGYKALGLSHVSMRRTAIGVATPVE